MRFLAVMLLSLLTSSVLHGQAEQGLKAALLKHLVVVRGFYVGSVLQFDNAGRLISPSTAGFGIDDASIYVTDLRLTPDRLIIIGQRTFQAYNQNLKQFQLAVAADKVELEIALPADKPASTSVPELLKQVLLTDSEMQNNCTPEEQARFQDFVSSKESRKKTEQAADSQGGPPICFPTGEKSYLVGPGIRPPKAIDTQDPTYPEEARESRIQGTVRLATIVNQQGRPTTIYIFQSAGPLLDEQAVEAVQGWRFQPSIFQDAPVPVAIRVEVNFRLH